MSAQQTVCHQCGVEAEPGDVFCGDCGSALTAVEPDRPGPPAPPIPEGLPAPPVDTAPHPLSPPAVRSARTSESTAAIDQRLLGSGEPNSHYIGQRLQYAGPDDAMDASGQLAAIFFQKLRIALIVAFVFVALSALIGFVLRLPDALKSLVFLVGLIGGVTIAAWPYFERQHIALSEWKLALDGRASAADGAFEHIARTVVDRKSPVDYRVVELPELGGRRYLQLRMGNFSGLVTCVPFGADLYVSWTLWWSCSMRELKKNEGAALWAALRDFITLPFRVLTGKVENTLDFALIHQFDDAKALREMVHSVTREGVQAAVGASPMTGRGTIGSTVPSGRDPQYASSR